MDQNNPSGLFLFYGRLGRVGGEAICMVCHESRSPPVTLSLTQGEGDLSRHAHEEGNWKVMAPGWAIRSHKRAISYARNTVLLLVLQPNGPFDPLLAKEEGGQLPPGTKNAKK